MISDSTVILAAVQRLRREILRLSEEHADASKSATYLGMTAAQGKTYDDRRKRIMQLVRASRLLEQTL